MNRQHREAEIQHRRRKFLGSPRYFRKQAVRSKDSHMAITIACPKCRASLKANKAPALDKLMKCLKCGHWFTLGDKNEPKVNVGVREGAAPIVPVATKVTSRPRDSANALFALAGFATVLLAGGGFLGAYLAFRPIPVIPPQTTVEVTPPVPKEAPPIAKVEPKAEPKTPPTPEPKVDLELEKRRQQFTHLMIDGGIANQLKNFDAAVAAYTEALRLFPDDADVPRKLGEARAAQQVSAKARLEQELIQKDAAALLKQGQEALDRKQIPAAIDFFRLALQKIPTSGEAAQRLLQAQNLLQIDDAKKLALDRFDQHVLAGKVALKAGRGVDAVREFTAAGKILPDDPLPPELLKEAEKSLVQVKNQEERQKDFKQLLDQAAGFLRIHKLDDAEQTYRQALKLFPNDPVALAGLDEIAKTTKKTKTAVDRLVAQANAAVRGNQLIDALAALREANRIAPTNTEVQRMLRVAEQIQENQTAYFNAMNRANTAFALKRYGDAILAYSEALRIVPNEPFAIQGVLDSQRGLEILNRLKIDYDQHVAQGLNLLKVQNYGDGARQLEIALKMIRSPLIPDPQVQRFYRYAEAMTKATNALSVRHFQPAVQFFQIALAEMPNDPAAQFGLQKARLGR